MRKADPVVERVRSVRRELFSSLKMEPDAILEWARRVEEKVSERVRGYERPRTSPPEK